MVSILSPKVGNPAGFNIDSLLGGNPRMSTIGTDFLHNSESAFTNVKSSTKDITRFDPLMSTRDCFPAQSLQPSAPATQQTGQQHHHSHKDSEFCVQCLDPSVSNLQDNVLNSVRSYEMSTQNLASINNINNRNLFCSGGFSSHSWPLLDPTGTTPGIQGHEYRQHSNFGNFGLKLHNNLVQLDNISNMSNLQSIANSYSPFSSLYSGMSQNQFGNQVGATRVDHGVSGPAFTWGTTRGAGFLTSRCPDTGLFMPSYRKPKRVRTAFSPTQLLRLEHAFEKNHYVVGQERKELSASLNLSETQVKVWFQNRRTKHKRMQTEEELTVSLSRRLREDRLSQTPSLEDVIIDQ